MPRYLYLVEEKGDSGKLKRVEFTIAELKFFRNSLLKLESMTGNKKKLRNMRKSIESKLNR